MEMIAVISDGAAIAVVTTIVSGVVTIVVGIIGFFTLWLKLKYGVEKVDEAATNAQKVEKKIDENTRITARIEQQTNGPLTSRLAKFEEKLGQLEDHNTRISALEVKVEATRTALDSLSKNLDSTRHEIRGQLQTISTSLHILSIKGYGESESRATSESKSAGNT